MASKKRTSTSSHGDKGSASKKEKVIATSKNLGRPVSLMVLSNDKTPSLSGSVLSGKDGGVMVVMLQLVMFVEFVSSTCK